MANKTAFEPDFSEDKFRVVVTVKHNSIMWAVEPLNGKQPTYFEVMGALEYTKFCNMENQREYNKELASKLKSEPTKEGAKTPKEKENK